MRLAIIGDTRHSYDASGRLHTLAPLARQLEPWLQAFESVVYCGTLHPGSPPSTHAPYPTDRVVLRELPIGGGDNA
ncbi:MAG TPA: hypothetical protein VFU47_09610, partial [Armatimonadota bacterium]|nr:hypothetical protein [Armatimonadota bacterium]